MVKFIHKVNTTRLTGLFIKKDLLFGKNEQHTVERAQLKPHNYAQQENEHAQLQKLNELRNLNELQKLSRLNINEGRDSKKGKRSFLCGKCNNEVLLGNNVYNSALTHYKQENELCPEWMAIQVYHASKNFSFPDMVWEESNNYSGCTLGTPTVKTDKYYRG